MKQIEILEAAWLEYHGYQMPQSGIAYLQDLVETFSRKRRGQTNKTLLAWFYESKPSNVVKVEREQDPTVRLLDTAHSTHAKIKCRDSLSTGTPGI